MLGGGQLGRMMAQAASRLGVSLTVLDPGGLASPAGMVSGQAITGSFTDAAKVRELAARCDVLTVEIEHVDAAVLAEIEAEGKVRVHPAPSTIAVLQDKLKQKRHLQQVTLTLTLTLTLTPALTLTLTLTLTRCPASRASSASTSSRHAG